MKLVRVLCVVSCMAAVGCGGPGKRHASGLPSDQVAEVRGIDDPWRILGMERHLSFEAAEGAEFSEGPVHVVELAPGHHTLSCHYRVRVDNSTFADGKKNVELDVEAGKAYQGDLVLERGGGCAVQFAVVPSGAPPAEKGNDAGAAPTGASKGSI
jgi:hypothetical protein